MTDYFALSLASVAGSSAPTTSIPIPVHTPDAPQPRPLTKDTPPSKPVLGLAIHLVQTPQGSMNEQQAAQRIQDMETMAQELEMALASDTIPEIILVEEDEPSAVSSEQPPETSQIPTNRDESNERERETVIALTFSSLFGRPSPPLISSSIPASAAGSRSSASFLNSSPTHAHAQSSEIICVITLPENTIFSVAGNSDTEVGETNAAPTRSAMPWFSPSYDPFLAYLPANFPRPSASTPSSLPYSKSSATKFMEALSTDVEVEEFDVVIIPSTIPHQAEQLEEPTAVLPLIIITSSVPPPSYTSFGDGRLQPSPACADLTELLGSDDDDGEVAIFDDDQDREQRFPSSVQAAAPTSAAPLALPLIATASSRGTLLALASPPVELSTTGTPPKPAYAYTETTPLSDQRPREKKRHVVDDRQPSKASTSASFAIKDAHLEHNISHPTSSSAPVASSPSAPPTSNFRQKFASLLKRRSPPATRAPRTPVRPTPVISTSSSTTTSTAGQSQKFKRKRDDDDDEEHGESSSSGAPKGRPSDLKIARDAPPVSKKPKSHSSTPTAPAHTTGHFRSAADRAHKRWEERMQQQQGGRMRVVSTDLLAMRAKARRSRASNVGR
ncbi:hypothetical protein C8T65DRAFT_737467 [Cerioporus squamosus]|nr:hypothetical protein C8T65DRAFT_737467 [Cerioporus squamosus]